MSIMSKFFLKWRKSETSHQKWASPITTVSLIGIKHINIMIADEAYLFIINVFLFFSEINLTPRKCREIVLYCVYLLDNLCFLEACYIWRPNSCKAPEYTQVLYPGTPPRVSRLPIYDFVGGRRMRFTASFGGRQQQGLVRRRPVSGDWRDKGRRVWGARTDI